MQAKESTSGFCMKPVGHLFMIANEAQHIPNHQSMNDTIYKKSENFSSNEGVQMGFKLSS